MTNTAPRARETSEAASAWTGDILAAHGSYSGKVISIRSGRSDQISRPEASTKPETALRIWCEQLTIERNPITIKTPAVNVRTFPVRIVPVGEHPFDEYRAVAGHHLAGRYALGGEQLLAGGCVIDLASGPVGELLCGALDALDAAAGSYVAFSSFLMSSTLETLWLTQEQIRPFVADPLASAPKSPAAMPTVRSGSPSPKLDVSSEAAAWLVEQPRLESVVQEAVQRLMVLFGADSQFRLKVVVDEEVPEHAELVLSVETLAPVQEALGLLDRFYEGWWFDLPAAVRVAMNVTVAFL